MNVCVRYFVPCDGDELVSPNEFYVRAGRADGVLRLGELATAFPLPGSYHFRFKALYKKSYVWRDLSGDLDEKVPRFEGAIFAKVSRLARHAASSSSAGAGAPASAARASVAQTSSPANDSVAQPPLRTRRQNAARAAAASESSDLLNLLAGPSDSPERSRRLSRRKSAEFKDLHSELLGQTTAGRPYSDGSGSSLDLAAMGDIFASAPPQAGAVAVLLSPGPGEPGRSLSAPGTGATSPRGGGQSSGQRRRSSLSGAPRRKSGATNLFESLGGF